MGDKRFSPQKPDIVVSGINTGANVGINVIYSGTVAGAVEAVADSQHRGGEQRQSLEQAGLGMVAAALKYRASCSWCVRRRRKSRSTPVDSENPTIISGCPAHQARAFPPILPEPYR